MCIVGINFDPARCSSQTNTAAAERNAAAGGRNPAAGNRDPKTATSLTTWLGEDSKTNTMVSLWPFKGDGTSAASFEKTLSQLSNKINKASASNDRLRQSKRQTKAFLTLYGTFAYIIVVLILVLVTGWERWGAVEYSGLLGGPVLMYGARTGLDAFYNYRIASSDKHLGDLQKQRETTIEKLKTATKYNSTQQLLDKYGGSPQSKGESPSRPTKSRKSDIHEGKPSTPQGGRTGVPPPPTANIPGKQMPSVPMTPERSPGSTAPLIPGAGPQGAAAFQPRTDFTEPNEEFAPNAFSGNPPTIQTSSQYMTEGPKWYDRIMDVVLGEDETSAKNRIALICQNCRLVNGQAPPGTRTLEDVGKWRCSNCRAWNGVESEENRILKQMSVEQAPSTLPTRPKNLTGEAVLPADVMDIDEEAADDEEMEIVGEDDSELLEVPPAVPTKSTARQRKKV